MAAVIMAEYLRRRAVHSERVFRDHRNPLDYFATDDEFYEAFRFRRHDILSLCDELAEDVELRRRQGSLSVSMQVQYVANAHVNFTRIVIYAYNSQPL